MEPTTRQEVEEDFGAAFQRMRGFARPSLRGSTPAEGKA